MKFETVVNSEPCDIGNRKRYFPYRCEMVPNSDLIAFYHEFPKLCKIVFWDLFKYYLVKSDWTICNRRQRNALHKKLQINNHYALKITEIAQRRYNYTQVTLAGNHIISRMGRNYRKYNNLSHSIKNEGDGRYQVFYENGEMTEKIKLR